ICSVHVRENQFGRGAGEIIFEFRCDKRATAGLRVQLEELRPRSCAEHIAHSDRPDASRHASQRDVLGVESAIEKEREAWSELIHWNSSRGEHFRISESV